MKLIDLVNIRNVFKPEMEFQNIQNGYKVNKFIKNIEQDNLFYNTKLFEIIQDCAEKDGDEIKTIENGNFIVAEDKISECNDRVVELQNIEVEVNLPSFKLEDFRQCTFSLKELSVLEPLISE